MKKNYLILISVAFICYFFTSCTNDDLDSQKINNSEKKEKLLKGISVVKLSNYDIIKESSSYQTTKQTSDADTRVLRFENVSAFNESFDYLKKLSSADALDFFKEINFTPAFATLRSADEELDTIFDIEDDDQFISAYNDFKIKSGDKFVYNDNDQYDLSPYLSFSDEKLQLLGNVAGIVVIGDKIISAEEKNLTYHEFFDETDFTQVSDGVYIKKDNLLKEEVSNVLSYKPNFLSYSGATMMIKSGKYQSTMTVGRFPDVESGRMLVRYASQKKKKFWKRRHETTYQGSIRLNSGNSIPFICGLASSEVFVESGIRRPNGRFYLHMNFTSGACSGVFGNKELWCQTN